jgi:Fe-S-cluster containining protein
MTGRTAMTERAGLPPISSGQQSTADASAWPAEDRFTCLPGCGLCCSYRVLVTEVDRQRLRAAVGNRRPWETAANGELALHRTRGFCLFLDSAQRCTVYEHRPAHCRSYPYLWTSYEGRELDVDLSCPGLGQGTDASAVRRETLAGEAGGQAQHARPIRQILDLLRVRQRFAAAGILRLLGQRCLDRLAASWPSSSLDVEQTRPLFLNAETADDVEELWSAFRLVPRAEPDLLGDSLWMKRHFDRPRWNTRLDTDRQVRAYRFWIARSTFQVETRAGMREQALLTAQQQVPWQPDALAVRRAYLQRWLERQLPVRLANNLALAAVQPGSHVATRFLQFLVDIDHRLSILALALAQAGHHRSIERTVALEAIRGSDGLLRAWCESARVGTTN